MSQDDPEIIERLASLETDIKWIKRELEYIKKSSDRYKWWILTGFVFVVALQIIIRLSLG
jgi:uncharacterized membrane protein YjjP (DUF1212 family)